MIPMIKADAYGVGVDAAMEALAGEAPAAWGVATVEEARNVRRRDPSIPVQVFSPLPPGGIERAWAHGIRVSLSDPDELRALPDGARGAFELELDTGMGRAGIRATEPADVASWARALADRVVDRGLEWHGVFTHLHSADLDEASEARRRCEAQIATFSRAVEALDSVCDAAGLPRLRRHVANSAAALRFPDLMRDIPGGVHALRPGIVLYGGRPVPMPSDADPGFVPREAVTVRARVARVVDVQAGATVGYGATHVAEGPRTWATILIGYGDGLPRALSNRGRVLLRGSSAPIVGRISMDMTVVDVTDIEGVQPGDVATVLGSDGDAGISLEELAAAAGTISYEILTGWGPRLPRVWHPDPDASGRGAAVASGAGTGSDESEQADT